MKLKRDKAKKRYWVFENATPHVSLRLPPDEKEVMQALVKRGRQFKIVYSVSYILREGARRFVKEQNLLLDKAEAGTLHAKQRNKQTVNKVGKRRQIGT
jgi:hypothetical protein